MKARIQVEDLRVSCLIGCLAPERRAEQEIQIDLEAALDVSAAVRGDDLSQTCDYASLSREIAFILQCGRFHLLETAADFLLRWLLLPPLPGGRPSIEQARVSLTKFRALQGDARARVSLEAGAADLSFSKEINAWGDVDVVAECRRMGLYRLNLPPGQEIPNHYHRYTREAELVLSGGLWGWREREEPRPREVGDRFQWARREEHGYRNVSDKVASILCLDAPPFDPSDEVEA